MEKRSETDQQNMLTSDEVAEWLGCSKSMVSKLKATRQIPSVKIGRLVRFRPADIDDYVQSRRAGAVV
jgi:excisionase family DNA binding protein